MKTMVLAGMILLWGIATDAQDYVPFPQSNAIWHSIGSNFIQEEDSLICGYRHMLNGDTIIESETWHKIYSLKTDIDLRSQWSYSAAIRETENKQILALLPGFPEIVLYDFGLEPGDTIWYDHHAYAGVCHENNPLYVEELSHFKVITGTDSLMLENGEYRKVWLHLSYDADYPDYGNQGLWIEGIGSKHWFGLFDPLIIMYTNNGDQFNFVCFMQDDEVLYLNNPFCDDCFCEGSAYHPFPKSDAVWNFYHELNCFWDGIAKDYYSIILAGDTLINGHTYQKLHTPFVWKSDSENCGVIQTGYKGAIREHTALKKVYYVPPGETIEQLLYDFTLQPGDTIRGFLGYRREEPEVVQSVDSVLIGDSYRKRWYINPWYNIHFIEGIGSTYGLIEPLPGYVFDKSGYSLTCFSQDGHTLYPDTITGCDLITHIHSWDYPTAPLQVYPNPSNGQTTLRITDETIQKVVITNMWGKIVFQQSLQGKEIITLEGLQAGTYLLTVYNTENQPFSQKLIISR